MIKRSIALAFLAHSTLLISQTTISGKVVDETNGPLEGANIYIEGTYDGASSDENGDFHFETNEVGKKRLIVSILSFETYILFDDVTTFRELEITMRAAINQLTGVTLTAGTFEAGDNTKVSVLKPLDIVTTAGAVGDFVAALQTLPGTSTVNEDGRLFVRGGAAGETQVFIDGLRVFQPFSATANNIPTRGRFSPFLFKGITFSTGGYSAEYGQALSSVLLLNTTDEPDQEKTDIGIMSVGGTLGHTEIWGNESLSLNTSYINLAPYEAVVPSDHGARWNRPFESVSGETVFRSKGERGMFKFYSGFNYTHLDIDQEDINYADYVNFLLKNRNFYVNTTFKHFLENGWILNGGASLSSDMNNITLQQDIITSKELATHIKIKAGKRFTDWIRFDFGAEHFSINNKDSQSTLDTRANNTAVSDDLTATFAESDLIFSNRFALKLGVRGEYTRLLNDFTLAPRVSVAYKSGAKSQFSFAYGDFYQNPVNDITKYAQGLDPEKTSHYILNYQCAVDGQTFRAEAYYKKYSDLTKFDTQRPQFNSNFSNLGEGQASGVDIFWRDNTTIKNLDYWVSYSFLDTQRDYLDFREKATPNFAAKHNLSIITKYWIDDWRSQLGISYNFASGRPYDNPNTPNFMAEKAKPYHNLSFNWAYLISPQKILYFSVSNFTGFKNISGYQYADSPNPNGVFERRAIIPTADTFLFVGFFWTISADRSSNQLNNL